MKGEKEKPVLIPAGKDGVLVRATKVEELECGTAIATYNRQVFLVYPNGQMRKISREDAEGARTMLKDLRPVGPGMVVMPASYLAAASVGAGNVLGS